MKKVSFDVQKEIKSDSKAGANIIKDKSNDDEINALKALLEQKDDIIKGKDQEIKSLHGQLNE